MNFNALNRSNKTTSPREDERVRMQMKVFEHAWSNLTKESWKKYLRDTNEKILWVAKSINIIYNDNVNTKNKLMKLEGGGSQVGKMLQI